MVFRGFLYTQGPVYIWASYKIVGEESSFTSRKVRFNRKNSIRKCFEIVYNFEYVYDKAHLRYIGLSWGPLLSF